MEIVPAYQGEALLLRWGDTHNGRTLTLQLDEHFGASHPFKGLKCGPNGQRMQIICVLIDENEQPVSAGNAGRQDAVEPPVVKSENASVDKPRTPFSSLRRSAQAGMKIKERDFQEWLGVDTDDFKDTVERNADTELKRRLAIVSKTDLDRWPEAGANWDKLLTDFDTRAYTR